MSYFVRSASLQHFADVVRLAGGDPEPLIRDSGFPIQAFDDPEMMLSAPRVAAFYERAAEVTGIVDLGLRTGNHGGLAGMGFIGVLARDCETLGEAFTALVKAQNYLNTRSRARIETAGDTFDIHIVLQEPDPALWRQLLEMTAAAIVKLFEELAGRPVPVVFVSFRHERYAPLMAYRRFLGTEPFFGAEAFVVSFDRRVMEWKVRGAMPGFRAMLERVAATRGAGGEPDVATLVEDNIAQLMRSGDVTIDAVATSLNLPPRSLQRMLAQSETTFSKLVDRVRDREASAYLRVGERSLGEIALLLGFQSQSAFARWCKVHWGESASERRQRLISSRPEA